MRRTFLLLLLISCMTAACASQRGDIQTLTAKKAERNAVLAESLPQSPVLPLPDAEEEQNTEALFSAFGLPVLLPENPSWIQDVTYGQAGDSGLEISYHDAISDMDCTLSAVRDAELDLDNGTYDESLDETWTGNTASGQWVSVKVRHPADGKTVLAVWEYGNYRFAIQGNVPDHAADTNTVPKTALFVISNLE